jgi:hypothetical protein
MKTRSVAEHSASVANFVYYLDPACGKKNKNYFRNYLELIILEII